VDGSLELIYHDESTGTSINLTSLQSSNQACVLAGVTVSRSAGLVLSTRLDLTIVDDSGLQDLSATTDGSFDVETAGDEETFSYSGRQLDVGGPYALLDATVTAATTGAAYRTLALEDPFPFIVLLPVAGVVAGGVWLWRRHKGQDKAVIETIQDSVRTAQKDGKPYKIKQQAESVIRFPFGARVESKSSVELEVGG
jgi:hypothetical protein